MQIVGANIPFYMAETLLTRQKNERNIKRELWVLFYLCKKKEDGKKA